MNKKMKIITLILSCVLLIGAAVGITVSAEQNPPTVSIAGQNISYEGAVRVAYYLSTANLGENQSVKLLVSDEKFDVPANITTPNGYIVKDVEDKVEFKDKDGKVTATYDIAYSDGIAPKELRDDIYAMAVVVNADGSVAARSAKKIYSPYKYAMNRFNGTPSKDQYGLYTALLNYGAAVQAVLNHNAEAGKWADEYIVVSQKTFTDGVEANTSFAIRGTTLENPVEYIYEAARWQGENKNVIFTGFTKADGTSYFGDNYAANWNKETLKPGEYTINANYTTEPNGGHYQTYDGQVAEGATTITGVNGVVSSDKPLTPQDTTTSTQKVKVDGIEYTITYYSTGYANFTEDKQLEFGKQFIISKITDSDGTEYPSVGSYVKGGYFTEGTAANTGVAVRQGNSTVSPYGNAHAITKAHIIEFDMIVPESTNYSSSNDMMQMFLYADSGSNKIYGVNIGATSSGIKITYESQNGTGPDANYTLASAISYNEVHSYRFEYYVDTFGEGTMSMDFYLDGEYRCTLNNTRATKANVPYSVYLRDEELTSVGFFTPNASKTTAVYIDNCYIGTVYGDEYHGKSQYQDITAITMDDYTGLYTSFTGSQMGKNYTANTEGKSGYYWYGINDGYYRQAAYNGAQHQLFKNLNSTVGDRYVFSMDIKWDGSTIVEPADSSHRSAAAQFFIGMGSTGTQAMAAYFYRVYATAIQGEKDGDLYLGTESLDVTYNASYYDTDGKTLTEDGRKNIIKSIEGNKNYFASLKAHTWYNLRMEYVPDIDSGVIESTSGTKTSFKQKGKLIVYINGDKVFENTSYVSRGEYTSATAGYKDPETARKFVNNDTLGWGFLNARGGGYITDLDISLDNVYLGAFSGYGNTHKDEKPYDAGYDGALDYSVTDEAVTAYNDTVAAGNRALAIATLGFGFSQRFDLEDGNIVFGAADTTTVSGYVNPNSNAARIVVEGDDPALEITSRSSQWLLTQFESKEKKGDKYVFNTNLKWVGSSVIRSDAVSDRWAFKIGIESSADDIASAEHKNENDFYMLAIYGYMRDDRNIDLYLNRTASGEQKYIDTIYYGDWANLDVVYTPGNIAGNVSGTVTVSVNGEPKLKDEPTYIALGTDNSDLKYGFIEMRYCARDAVLLLDDTFCSAVADEAVTPGHGKYADNSGTIKFNGAEYEYYLGHSDASDKGYYSVSTIDGVLNYSKVDPTSSNYNPHFYNGYRVSNPEKMIYEFDVNVLAENFAMQDGREDEWAFKVFFQNGNANFDQAFLIPRYDAEGKFIAMALCMNSNKAPVAYLLADQWYNIRLELTGEKLVAYVNGELVGEKDAANSALVADLVAGLEMRRYTATATWLFDNVYVGFESENAETYIGAMTDISGEATVTQNEETGITNLQIDRDNVSSHGSQIVKLAAIEGLHTSDLRIGDVITVEVPIKLNSVVNNYSTWLFYIGFGTDDVTSSGTYDASALSNTISFANRGTSGTAVTNPGIKNGYLTYGKWHMMRNTLKITGIDAETGSIKASLYTYFDGKQQASGTKTGVFDDLHDITGLYLKTKATKKSGGTDCVEKYDFDFGEAFVTINHNGGAEYDRETLVSGLTQFGQVTNDFANGELGNLLENTTSGIGKIATESVGDVTNYYLNIANGANGSGERRFYVMDSSDALGYRQTGSIYEASFKFRFNAIDTPSGKSGWNDWVLSIGLGDSSQLTSNFDNAVVCYTINGNSNDGSIRRGSWSLDEADGDWHQVTIRAELKRIDGSNYYFDYWLIIDGEFVFSYPHRVETKLKDIDCFAFKFKGGNEVSYNFDFDDFVITSYNTTETPAE